MKKKLPFKFILLVCCLMAGISMYAQENFDNPIVIGELIGTYDCGQIPFTDSRNNADYANDIEFESGDVFYEFTVSNRATIEMDMCDANFDSYIFLYNDSQQRIASNDDGALCYSVASYLQYTVDPGTYYVICEGLFGSSGDYSLDVYVSAQAPIPDVESLPSVEGSCTVTVSEIPTASSACSGASVAGTTADPLTYSLPGTYTITWAYNDAGLIAYQEQTVVVHDGPVPDLETLPVLSGECSYTVSEAPTAYDNCVGAITGTTSDPTSYLEQGSYTITWSYDDGAGHVSTQEQTILVDDVTAPVPDVETLAGLYGQCSYTVSEPPTATDNCAGTITGTTTDPTSYTEQGIYTITWTYEDGNGNTSTQEQTVVVDDVFDPVPDVETLPTLTGECSVNVSVSPIAWDNCEGAITATSTDPFSYTEQGEYTMTWSYDDGNGNIATQTQTIIVNDISAPVPDLDVLPEVSGECSVTVSEVPTASDNCEGSIIGTTDDPLEYTGYGTYTITWTYDDGNGNTSTQDQTVVVEDNTAPVPDAVVLTELTAICSITVSEPPTATDNCAGSLAGTTDDPLEYTEQGSYTITWIYDDGHGNSISQEQTVTIQDTVAPSFTCPGDVVSCDGTVSDIALTNVEDNCSGVSVSYVLTGATEVSGSGDAGSEVFNAGVTTVTYSVVDGAGNSASCSLEVNYEAIDISVTQDDATLTANGTGEYQWINCTSGEAIEGETNQSFTAIESGSYAVVVSGTNCADTSDCYDYVNTGTDRLVEVNYRMYPNPTSGIVTIEFEDQLPVSVRVVNMMGQEVYAEEAIQSGDLGMDLSDLSNGMYLVYVKYTSHTSMMQLVKQ
ncbi:MAG: T9SS type A sorting domain-containing protein [Bacteroidales bacterium]|nr:T9SS type A sorting domain-containing protein [Bacteroidales bacterium]